MENEDNLVKSLTRAKIDVRNAKAIADAIYDATAEYNFMKTVNIKLDRVVAQFDVKLGNARIQLHRWVIMMWLIQVCLCFVIMHLLA